MIPAQILRNVDLFEGLKRARKMCADSIRCCQRSRTARKVSSSRGPAASMVFRLSRIWSAPSAHEISCFRRCSQMEAKKPLRGPALQRHWGCGNQCGLMGQHEARQLRFARCRFGQLLGPGWVWRAGSGCAGQRPTLRAWPGSCPQSGIRSPGCGCRRDSLSRTSVA